MLGMYKLWTRLSNPIFTADHQPATEHSFSTQWLLNSGIQITMGPLALHLGLTVCLGEVLHSISAPCGTVTTVCKMCVPDQWGCDAISPVSITLTHQKHRWRGTIMIVRWSQLVVRFCFPSIIFTKISWLFMLFITQDHVFVHWEHLSSHLYDNAFTIGTAAGNKPWPN